MILGLGGIVIAWFTWLGLWMILGALAIIMGIIGVNKDETKTLSIIGIVFGIIQVSIFIVFLYVLYIILY